MARTGMLVVESMGLSNVSGGGRRRAGRRLRSACDGLGKRVTITRRRRLPDCGLSAGVLHGAVAGFGWGCEWECGTAVRCWGFLKAAVVCRMSGGQGKTGGCAGQELETATKSLAPIPRADTWRALAGTA